MNPALQAKMEALAVEYSQRHLPATKSKSCDWYPDQGFELFLESLAQGNKSGQSESFSDSKKSTQSHRHLKLVLSRPVIND